MRTIATEEAFQTKAFRTDEADRVARGIGTPRFDILDAYMGWSSGAFMEVLGDLGAGRLADMDRWGIDMQVLGHTNMQMIGLDEEQERVLVTEANNELAEVIRAHPDRFAGWAVLPMRDPVAAIHELQRVVRTPGICGVMVNGAAQTGGVFLDDARYRPLLRAAAENQIPIYIHPGFPPPAVNAAYHEGFSPAVTLSLMSSGWSWHAETGLHALRLMLAGVFDELPDLQIVIGHMGEMMPFMLGRMEMWFPRQTTGLDRTIGDYFRENFYITTSGFFDPAPLQCALSTIGADRILFAVDYPYSRNEEARAFLDHLGIARSDLEKITHRNAERLLKLG
ncbi:amidohydrolase family protein [Microbacterium pseudoresistens]|uniref:Amidohydrolase-related domain-containing protein n=1 Tax=Microbacterium pseudoresistens TaxID=640634 RepID=A0A7Y9EU20_9MICO|nr:amidohydrolase family protein [Microbacterium pseudoresistens]NYD53952.1 hypothetical protein [Microbacterium pseudoresistens]